MAPDVSIVIPTYNRARWLAAAIESALDQRGVTVEVVVVDDGSPSQAAETVTAHYPQVRYIYQSNQGLGAARNRGIKASTGRHLLFLDDDDWLTPEAVAGKLVALAPHSEIAVAYSDLYLAQADGQVSGRYYAGRARPLPAGDIYADLLLRNFIPIHALLWRRTVVEAVGGFPLSQGTEDWHLLVRVAEEARFAYVDEPQGYYRLHDGNMTLRYDRQVAGAEVTQRHVANSARFAALPGRRRARILTSYAWQQWVDGDPLAARDFLRQARAASPSSPLPWLASALMLLGRPLARRLMRAVWRVRAWRQAPTASGYFLRRV
jgi:glycosyltransferase involved in cell wall biosynthesis